MSFDGTIVLITGGAGGIGRAIGHAFAREGATVVLAGRDAAALADAVKEIGPGTADHVVADVTDPASAARMRTAVPAGRVASTSEVASTVLWLASDASTHVVGHDLVIDGGVTA